MVKKSKVLASIPEHMSDTDDEAPQVVAESKKRGRPKKVVIVETPEVIAPVIEEVTKERKKRTVKPKVKRPLNDWALALAVYNEGKDKYLIPKKGSTEYSDVTKVHTKVKEFLADRRKKGWLPSATGSEEYGKLMKELSKMSH